MKIQNLPAQLTSDGSKGVVIALLSTTDANGSEAAMAVFVEPTYGQASNQPIANIKFEDPTMKALITG